MSAFSQKFQKKNSGPIKDKPKTKPTGWEDDDEDPVPSIAPPQKHEHWDPRPPVSLVMKSEPKADKFDRIEDNLGLVLSTRIIFASEFDLLSPEQLSEKNTEYEAKLVEDIIQPQGAKIKPPEDLLLEFGKACESLQTQVVCSVLLASLGSDISWKSIIKCLYVIEFLCKRLPAYRRYFRYHKEMLEDLQLNAEPAQLKQMKTAHLAVMEQLMFGESTSENSEKKILADPLLEKYKLQEKKENQPKNLLEDSDQEKKKPKIVFKQENKSGFSFIQSQQKNPSASNSSNLLTLNTLNNMNNNMTNMSHNNNMNMGPVGLGQAQPQIKVDPLLASIDFAAQIKEERKTEAPIYNLNPRIMHSNSRPVGNPSNPNYHVLDFIPQQQPFYNPYNMPNSINPMMHNMSNNNGKPFQYPSTNNSNNNSRKESFKTAANTEKEEKESAFDFVNDLVKLK